jgi:hypothetical protein
MAYLNSNRVMKCLIAICKSKNENNVITGRNGHNSVFLEIHANNLLFVIKESSAKFNVMNYLVRSVLNVIIVLLFITMLP